MAKNPGDDPFSSQKNSRLPNDTVFFTIFSDSTTSGSSAAATSELSSLQLQILQALSPYTSDYIWQHEPFSLSVSSDSSCFCSSTLPHIHGKLRFGDNLEDEWFVVFLLFEASRLFSSISVRVWDTDGEFLLIEAAFHLPRWINPDTSLNRLFIRRGDLRIVSRDRLPNPSLLDSLMFLSSSGDDSRAPEPVQAAVKNRISDYPERARSNVHRARVRVPASVAQVLKHEPCLISLAVEGFYDRDIDSMKFAAKMERFLSGGREEELVCASVKMSRAMYAQLAQQTFQAPRCYPMPSRSEGTMAYQEAELGMKIACGFEMIYQQRREDGLEGKGSTWEAFRDSLESSGFFEGLLPGSNEYKRLMQKAEEDYRKGSSFTRASEMMSAPVRRIDEILALPHSADAFRNQEVPLSDDDSWLYSGEEELNSALLAREKEMELYNSKHKKNQKPKEEQDVGSSSGPSFDGLDLGDIAKTMQAFVQKVSSYKGAEVPDNKNMKEVDIDVDRFMKDIESVMRLQGSEETDGDVDVEDGSSSDMEFDESEDGSDMEDADDGENEFMDSYSDALNEELKSTSLEKSFIRASEQSSTSEIATNANSGADGDFTPIDVDVNLVKSLLDSFSSQQGLPGPASNLLGLMGLKLPQDSSNNKGK